MSEDGGTHDEPRAGGVASTDDGEELERSSQAERLDFYSRLRSRLQRSLLEERGLKPGTVEALLIAPDLFMLLVRLSLDRRVPASSRALIGTALVYFVAPFDLVPEALLGAGGFVDDLVLAAAVLTHALSDDLDEVAAEHWSGRASVRVVLRDVLGSAHSLLGQGPMSRLRSFLEKRGVDLPPDPRGPAT